MSTGQPYKKALDDIGIALSIYTTILFNYTFQHIYSKPMKGHICEQCSTYNTQVMLHSKPMYVHICEQHITQEPPR